MNRKIVFVLLLAIFVMPFFSLAPSFLPKEAYIRVLALSYEPNPALPGKLVELKLKIDNYAQQEAPDVEILLKPKYPFSLKPGESASRKIGRLDPSHEFYVTYNLIVSPDAVGDTYEMELWACPDTCDKERFEEDIEIKVEADADFLVKDTIFSPESLSPGKTIKVKLGLENVGFGLAENTFVTVDTTPKGSTSSNLFLIRGTGNTISLGDVKAHQEKNVRFDLTIGEDASGIFQLPLTVTYRSSGLNKQETLYLPLYVEEDVTTDLQVVSVSSNPEKIVPGKTADVTVNLKNVAKDELKKVITKLSFSGTDNPFSPLGSSSEIRLDSIAEGKEEKITFKLITDGTASPGVYKIPFTITYLDEADKSYTKSDLLSLIIAADPELSFSVLQPTYFRKGTTEKVVINVKNTGVESTKSISVNLGKNSDFKLLSDNSVFITSLASSTSTTATFSINVDEGFDRESVTLPLTVMYRDSFNNAYTKEISLPLNVYSITDKVAEVLNDFVALKIKTKDSNLVKLASSELVSFEVINEGMIPLKFVKITLLSQDGIKILSEPTEYVEMIDSNAKEEISYKFHITGTESKDVTLKFAIEFRDDENQAYSVETMAMVHAYGDDDPEAQLLGTVPQVQVGIERADVFKAGKTGKIVLNVVNKGKETVKFLNMNVKSVEGGTLRTVPQVYVGKLESDDVETVEYEIYINPASSSGEKKLDVEITYEDTEHKQYTKLYPLSINILSAEELKKMGGSSSSSTMVGGLVLLVVLYFVYKKFWK